MDQGIDVVLGALDMRVGFEHAPSPEVVRGLLTHDPGTNGTAKKAAKRAAKKATRSSASTKAYETRKANDRPLSAFVQEFLERNGPATNGQIVDGVLAMGYKTVTKRKNFTGSIGSCLSIHKFPKRNGLYSPIR